MTTAIETARRAALAVLKPSKRDLEHGLALLMVVGEGMNYAVGMASRATCQEPTGRNAEAENPNRPAGHNLNRTTATAAMARINGRCASAPGTAAASTTQRTQFVVAVRAAGHAARIVVFVVLVTTQSPTATVPAATATGLVSPTQTLTVPRPTGSRPRAGLWVYGGALSACKASRTSAPRFVIRTGRDAPRNVYGSVNLHAVSGHQGHGVFPNDPDGHPLVDRQAAKHEDPDAWRRTSPTIPRLRSRMEHVLKASDHRPTSPNGPVLAVEHHILVEGHVTDVRIRHPSRIQAVAGQDLLA